MKRIVYMRSDGGTSIIVPATDERIEVILIKDVPVDAQNVRVVDESEIPSDRTFRNAWKPDLSVDMPKALVIAQDKVRAARAPKLAALDVEFQRAIEDSDNARQAAVALQKRRLRDATSDARITQAQTPEALKAAMQAVIAEL